MFSAVAEKNESNEKIFLLINLKIFAKRLIHFEHLLDQHLPTEISSVAFIFLQMLRTMNLNGGFLFQNTRQEFPPLEVKVNNIKICDVTVKNKIDQTE